ncbi:MULTISPECIES: DUF3829 domain-containing protein [unclassified Pseudomonas]|uniref:DUF3829 domain-containing protein n=1 Tax=unclassified Pseudomonas TaxID=196821 RepID=UPI00200C1CBB|nr:MULTISPECIES: DUF3829 domain-containing protein [unclassified Pseudomonas]
MNKRVNVVVLAVVLSGAFLNLVKDHQEVLVPLQRWLQQPDLAEREKSAALRPLIACLNIADARWRHAYNSYLNRDLKADTTLQQRFPEDFDGMAKIYEELNFARVQDAYGCQLNAAQKTSLQTSTPELLPLQNRFETTLKAANEVAASFDFFSYRLRYAVSPDEKAERDNRFIPLAEAFLDASDQLRRALSLEEQDLRRVQLEQLKGREQFKYAHILNYMLQAQTLMLDLDERVRERSLALDDLSDGAIALRNAWDSGNRYMQLNTATSSADYPESIWNHVREPGERYLLAVNRLHEDWVSKAPAQQLSDDFERIGRAYDQLIEVYNSQVSRLF